MDSPVRRRALIFVAMALAVLVGPAAPLGGAAPAIDAPPSQRIAPLPPELAAILVTVGGKPLPLADAIRQAAADERLAHYRQLREEHAGTADGERRLALWCRKQKLADEERLHWWSLLALEPDRSDAIRALGLQKYQGLLLTSDEIDHAKQEEQAAKRADRRWRPKLTKLKRAIVHGDDAERAAALRQLQAIDEPRALPLIEEIFLVEDAAIISLIVETVAKMPTDAAAELLARLAVDASDEYVREQAIRALESRPYHSYVPQLIAELATPIELNVSVSVDPGGPVVESYTAYAYTGEMGPAFYNKFRPSGNYSSGDVAAWGAKVRRSSGEVVTGYQPDRVQYHYVLTREGADPDNPNQVAGTLEGVSGDARPVASLKDLEAQIAADNEATAALNQRLHAVLAKATRVDVLQGDLQQADARAELIPRRWWDWWRTQTQSKHFIAQGIDVWTQTGLAPIEQIRPGDRVLSRNGATDELSFQLVLAVDQQGEAAMLAIEIGGRTIVAAPEQQFQVADAGWQTAGELKPGMKLESLTGPKAIERVGPTEALARFSLLVAGAPNFFVDPMGVAVHDASRP